MIIVALFMLLAPGLISIRILWNKKASKGLKIEDYKFIACDYIIYTFLIQTAVYGFMFFTYPERLVSFALNVYATSHILSASFVFKYSFMALTSALILPALVPWATNFFINLENNRGKKNTNKER